ncbi:MAG: bifunctional 2,3-cyclic-nucleotide 2-phosphodiesterase/3-nucleotidase [Massilia sp.]|nr:bifunctional 2,3-cyclic-nucleotide 2-phosphodiesterase/3-nucleotidase [Massilia sp.]
MTIRLSVLPCLTPLMTPLMAALLLAGCASTSLKPGLAPGATATLAVLETTDVHANVLGYDYYKLAEDKSFGLDRAATLIARARAEFPNTLLLDNGDTIQGTALADYQALVKPIACSETLSVYKVMNHLGMEGGGVGNHEFNYGLKFLNQVTGSHFEVDGVEASAPRCAGPAFPQVLANVYSSKTKKQLFKPYHIIDKQINASGADGKPVTTIVKVGIIGFTPPTIVEWDKRWLDGKVYTVGIRETAEKYVPQMRAEGADIVVAISHGGLDDSPYSPSMENGNWYLSKVAGIDAMLIGHSHQIFPNAASAVAQFNLPGVDKAAGTVNGVPTTMANLWGKHLGVIGLHLNWDGAHWVIDKKRTTVEARGAQQADKSFVAADPGVVALVAREHAATIAYVKTPVGESAFRMSSYFADVGDVSAIAPVNAAQTDYVARYVKANLPQYAALPVLSMASAFKSGFSGVNDYTDVAAGKLAMNHAADLYLYPNSLYAVKVDGAGLKAWLEHSARHFHTIDPANSAPQELIDPSFASFNFDVATTAELRYEIDVTKPLGQRIVQLTYRGKPVEMGQEFIVATNNYRASGGGSFPGLDGSRTILASPDANRDVLINWIKAAKTLNLAAHGANRSWHFAKVKTAGPVVFHSAPDKLALAKAVGIDNVTQLKADDGKGFAVYAVDLSR